MRKILLLLIAPVMLLTGCKSSFTMVERQEWEKIYEKDEEVSVTIPVTETRGRVFVISEDTFLTMIHAAIEEEL